MMGLLTMSMFREMTLTSDAGLNSAAAVRLALAGLLLPSFSTIRPPRLRINRAPRMVVLIPCELGGTTIRNEAFALNTTERLVRLLSRESISPRDRLRLAFGEKLTSVIKTMYKESAFATSIGLADALRSMFARSD